MSKIALGTDHAGYKLKEAIKNYLLKAGHEVSDFGTTSPEPVDYPDFVIPAAESVARGECARGVVFGGSGNGEAIAANKVAGVRCAVCWNIDSARLAKYHNNANVIALGGRMVTEELAVEIVKTWLETNFEGDRHERRLEKISEYERESERLK